MSCRSILAAVVVLALSVTAQAKSPPKVTRIAIAKSEHSLTLFADDRSVATYRVAIGPGGRGFKQREGDQVTPVGRYHVTMHQPSEYRIFLRLDYPNADDRARFARSKAEGSLPPTATIGSDIGIHGAPRRLPEEVKVKLKESDWTLGCVAVDDDEIAEIARLVADGTPVDIAD